MFYKLAAWQFSKNPNYLSILKKAELGVYYFCRKVAIECEKHGFNDVAKKIRNQAEAEYNHAQSFSKLMGGKLALSYKDLAEKRGEKTINWTKVNWDSNEEYIATNLSQNAIAQLFFKGKSADSYGLLDKIAFMQVLEMHQAKFYKALCLFVPLPVFIVLKNIQIEEERHSQELTYEFGKVIPLKYLNKWKRRAWLVLLKLPFYLAKNV